MFTGEAIPENVLAMTCEALFLSVNEVKLTDEQSYRVLTQKHDHRYQGDLGGSFVEEFQKGIKYDTLRGCM